MHFFAHTYPEFPSPQDADQYWEPLFSPFGTGENQCQGDTCSKCLNLDRRHGHLNKVAWWTAKFASEMFPSGSEEAKSAWDWGYLAGLWHDLGKYSIAFRNKLFGEKIQIEHAGTGAALAKEQIPIWWETLGFIIAGHHSGLTNRNTKEGLTPLDERTSRAMAMLEDCRNLMIHHHDKDFEWILKSSKTPEIPSRISAGTNDSAFQWNCYIRMIFSALVDADSIATESFCSRDELKAKIRAIPLYESIHTIQKRLDEFIDQLSAKALDTDVNRQRTQILEWCREAAKKAPGFFTLNVPTGGGKTLAGMSFALRHALANQAKGMRRVIVAVPYTSIIEQNADIYKEALGYNNVIEHHSNLDDFAEEEESNEATVRRRMLCENWNTPVIVTTNVQLLESLFTHKRGRARKLHHIAGSVIILDEAQCVPVGFMALIVPMLRELTENYGCTVVISTATQPAWQQTRGKPSFGIPAEKFQHIIPPEAGLPWVNCFDRVIIEWPKTKEPLLYEKLVTLLCDEPCVMAIVHRKKDAQWLAREIKRSRPMERVFHLSTNMCPAHRRQVLEDIRKSLIRYRESGIPCRIVSTQLVEAGVDLDLPVIYRAIAGLDSIAQAAGRCNREGRIREKGRLVVFQAETDPPDPHLKRCAEITIEMLNEFDAQLDLRNPANFESFFRRLYHNSKLDSKDLLRHMESLNFETLGKNFRLIADNQQISIVILYDQEAKVRLKKIQNIAMSDAGEEVASRVAFRALQSYSVAIWPKGLTVLERALEPLFPGSTAKMLDLNLYPESYNEIFGLVTDDEPAIPFEKLIN